MSDMSEIWRNAFATWPTHFRRKGVVVPDGSEAIPFVDFVMTETMVVLERPTPDNAGARRVALPFDRIHNLKYTEPLKTEQFLKAGFVKEMEISPQQAAIQTSPQRPSAPAPTAPAPANRESSVAVSPPQQTAAQSSPQPSSRAAQLPTQPSIGDQEATRQSSQSPSTAS